ncbi:hypothetical protein [Pseudoxanthomonas indica]|uniref:PsiF repeat-containing protein n=1 Tax=Pseudoxanthomonas indica TaxID=428993 RepID=A0A1T5K6D9_9GAMM|nr:hypothetical protein [Pseudoxanthomonas indica]GGD47129.1 hypothetical protein GCM10007235_18790 [Pseudoxanthomonas indica]SKC59307.1 hypothetical protein SAMN06296058_1418 [Pseudoxanthomonas indica]
MKLRTPLLALGLSLATVSAFATNPPQSSEATAKPAVSAKVKPADTAAKDKHDCAKRNKMGHCEQWSAKPSAQKPAEVKH